MALTVQTNTAALTALKNLNTNSANMNQSLNRLSSGFRVNSAADDASGFAVASKLSAQGSALKAASQNATQATAMVKMADAGVNEIQNMIVRVQTLATQASSANSSGELAKLDAERTKLETQIDKIANSTNYNGVSLLNGTGGSQGTMGTVTGMTGVLAASGTNNGVGAGVVSADGVAAGNYAIVVGATTDGGAGTVSVTFNGVTETLSYTDALDAGSGATTVTSAQFGLSFAIGSGASTGTASATVAVGTGSSSFQVGANNNADNRVTVALSNSYTTTSLGLGAANGDLLTQSAAQSYITTAQGALDKLITQRADLGATQNQLGFVQANLATSIEQVTSAVSSIKDADMALEMADFTKNKILTQAGTSMLAQANQASQNVLSLFR